MGLSQSILDTIAERLGYTKKGMSVSDLVPSFLTPYSGSTRLYNQRQYMEAYLDWVYAAVNAVSQDVGMIEFQAFANRSTKPTGKMARTLSHHPEKVKLLKRAVQGASPELEELPNHILLDLLAHPNPFMDGEYFMELTCQHLLLAGEAFWAKIRNNYGKPAQLWPMMPYSMKHVPDRQKFISGWLYWVGGEDVPWDVEDVVHIKLPNPNDFYRGMSVIKAAARAIDTDSHAADWNRNFFNNGAEPGFVLETDQTLSETVYTRLKAEWESRHQGTANAHKLAILEAGLKADVLTTSQKDMDFVAGRNFNKDQILGMFKVSASILGLTTDHNRANMDAADYNHAKRAVLPNISRINIAVNHALAPEYDSKLVVAFDNPVPDDKDFDLKERTESVNKYRTVNEIRQEVGDDPLPGGDVLYIPINVVPMVAESAKPTPPPEVGNDNSGSGDNTPTNEPNNPKQDALGGASSDPKGHLRLKQLYMRRKRIDAA